MSDSWTRRGAIALGLAAATAPSAAFGAQADIKSAFAFAFPIFEFARTQWASAGPREAGGAWRLNSLNHRRAFSDHTHRIVTAPNNDTLYSIGWLDLSGGPVIVDTPTVQDRYHSVQFMDRHTDNFFYLGTRTTGGVGARVAVVGPDWRGAAPEGAQLVRATSNDVWMLARVLAVGPEDLAAARAVQDGIKVTPMAAEAPPQVRPGQSGDWENFLAVVNERLGRGGRRAAARASRRFAALGLAPGRLDAWARLPESTRARWRDEAPTAIAALREGWAIEGAVVNGWRYPPALIGSRAAPDSLRAAVALSGFGALEQAEASYVRANADGAGAPLDGTRAYELRMPADVPAAAFWSVTMYAREPDGRLFFVENELGRYAIGDRTAGLVRDADGGVRLLMQRTRPSEGAANWLPTPAGPFAVMFRAYLPKPDMLSGAWRLPPVTAL